MDPMMTISQVLGAVDKVREQAPAYCTNFFPLERKLQGWIDHGELFGDLHDQAAFFLRKDRDFWHLYYCAANHQALGRNLDRQPLLKTEPVVVDLVGRENALPEVLAVMDAGGFRLHRRLQRMVRGGPADFPSASADATPAEFAGAGDAPAILDLLVRSFDRHAEQLPMPYEIEAAIQHRQILVVKHAGTLAALLFFETQGLASTVRYWLVDEPFRTFRYGSALMHRYFALHQTARRFLLWVLADNAGAIQKYQHYGYAADGLIDLVLANRIICA